MANIASPIKTLGAFPAIDPTVPQAASADQIADGETNVSMTRGERDDLAEVSAIFRQVDGVNGIVLTDVGGNEVGFIPFDNTRSTQFPFLTAAPDRGSVGPFTAFVSPGGNGIAIVDEHRSEVAFIPFDEQELRLPYTSVKKDALAIGPLTVRLLEGIDGIVFTDEFGNGIAPPGGSSEGGSLDKAAVLKQSRPANSVVTQGHSKTQQNSWNGSTNPSNPNGGTARKADLGWLAWADYFLRGSINWIWNAGVGGENDAQIIARMANDVVAKDPAWCFMMGGTCNSINAGRTADEIIATQLGTETQDSSNSILGVLQDAGIRTLWLTDPTWYTGHADLTPAKLAILNRVNRAMLRAPSYKSGLLAVDAAGLFVDPLSAVGSAKQYWLQDDDNIHPSPLGARAAGYLMAQRLLEAGFPMIDILVASAADTYGNSATSRQLLDNPLMIATGNPLAPGGAVTGIIPDGWEIATSGSWAPGSITSSVVPHPSGYGYEWIVEALDAPANNSSFTLIGQDIRSRVTTGDVLEAAAQVDLTGMSKVKGHELVCNLSDGTVFPAISTLERDATVNDNAGWGHQFYDQADIVGGAMKTGKASVPSNSMSDGSGRLRFRATFGDAGGTATVKMSRAQILKNS